MTYEYEVLERNYYKVLSERDEARRLAEEFRDEILVGRPASDAVRYALPWEEK